MDFGPQSLVSLVEISASRQTKLHYNTLDFCHLLNHLVY